MLAPAGRMAMSMCHPFLLALLGLLPLCKSLNGAHGRGPCDTPFVDPQGSLHFRLGPLGAAWHWSMPAPFGWPLRSWATYCLVLNMLSPCGVHGEVHVSPLLLALWGPGPSCWGLRGGVAEIHVRPVRRPSWAKLCLGPQGGRHGRSP